MNSIEEKSCYTHGYAPEAQNTNKEGGNRGTRRRKGLGSTTKPTPSKWDDAQKWLAGLSRGGGGGDHSGHGKNKPRNSNAEDRRLITAPAQKGRDSCASYDEAMEESETKKIDLWHVSKPAVNDHLLPAARSVSVRDMGTEMTPAASLEPSRTATPIRAGTPMRSPMSSRSSTPGRARPPVESYQTGVGALEAKSEGRYVSREAKNSSARHENGRVVEEEKKGSSGSLESRAIAWDEAERAKYMARYKREEVRIQAWESRQKRNAETEMRRMEVKAERMKARAQEKLANKLAATRRIAEEKRANAEAILNEQAAKTTERADYIRRTGHLPSNFSFKLPTLCW